MELKTEKQNIQETKIDFPYTEKNSFRVKTIPVKIKFHPQSQNFIKSIPAMACIVKNIQNIFTYYQPMDGVYTIQINNVKDWTEKGQKQNIQIDMGIFDDGYIDEEKREPISISFYFLDHVIQSNPELWEECTHCNTYIHPDNMVEVYRHGQYQDVCDVCKMEVEDSITSARLALDIQTYTMDV